MIHSNAGIAAYWGGVVTDSVGIYTLSCFHHHMLSKTGTTAGYGSVLGGVFTGSEGIVIILLLAPILRVVCSGHVRTAV